MIELLVESIERLRYGMRRPRLPDGFPFWGFTDPRIGDLSITDRRVGGHTPRRHGPGDWRCTYGRLLSGGSLKGRADVRDAMRFHRLDLNHPQDFIEHTPQQHRRADRLGGERTDSRKMLTHVERT